MSESADQATRQIDASGGRPVVWVFAEAAAEKAARELFDADKKLARIETIWIPTQETPK
jgi:NADPH-dependent ferric siderophore reductase